MNGIHKGLFVLILSMLLLVSAVSVAADAEGGGRGWDRRIVHRGELRRNQGYFAQ